MALARVVTFDNVDRDRIAKLKSEIEGGEPPEGMNPQEMLLLHDPDASKSIAIVFFANEDDYRAGDEMLNAMDPGDTPGQRTSVGKYDVALRMTM
jgi:hypothetical protein